MIDLNAINREEFEITEKDGLFLILPDRFKINKSWNLNELHMRTLLVNSEGRIVSSGMPKFFNYGEHEDYDQLFFKAMESNPGRVFFAPKLDGSLVIRDVINGEVNIRTRGTHKLEPHHNEYGMGDIMPFIEQSHSKLLDPTFCTKMSLLFEFTSPNNQIVIRYTEPKLTYLGTMTLGDMPTYMPPVNGAVAFMKEHLNIESVPVATLDMPLSEFKNKIDEIEGEEGVVVYVPYDHDWLMLKMKTEWYFKLHSILTGMSDDFFRKLMWESNAPDLESFRQHLLFEKNFDVEIFLYLKDKAEEWYSDIKLAKEKLINFRSLIEEKGILNLATRKEQVMTLQEITDTKEDFTLGLWFLDGQEEIYLGIKALDMTKAQFQGYCRDKVKEEK